MKLRNKETGKVQTCDMVVITDEKIDGEIASLNKHTFIFRSIEQFNDEWEDYKPKEPLIKDEKIRKAIRAWAEALDIDEVYINYIGDNTYIELYEDPEKTGGWNRMSLPDQNGIKKNERYTIAELCGEEEE